MNIGLIGCSPIVEKAILIPLDKTGLRVCGVASRNPLHAKEFAEKHHIDRWYESYEALFEDPSVEAVYLALPPHLHADFIVRALRAGKHVLCEKPICQTVSEWERIEAALPDGLCLMEGVMTKYHRWQDVVRRMAEEGEYGSLLRIKTEMNIIPKPHFYTGYRGDVKSGGVFRDLSCYWLQWIQGFFKGEVSILRGSSDFSGPGGTDWDFHAALCDKACEYGFDCAYASPYKTNHTLELEHATLMVRDFFRASVGCYKMKIKIEEHPSGAVREIVLEPEYYYENQLCVFEACSKAGRLPEPLSAVRQRIDFMERLYRLALAEHRGGNHEN